MSKLKAFLAAMLGGASVAIAAEPEIAAKAVNELGVQLHQRLATGDENLCVSPYSIQAALAMTFAGADGATRTEMAKVLHFPEGDAVHESFAALHAALAEVSKSTAAQAERAKRSGGPGEPFILKTANRLFGEKTYEFKAPFLTQLREIYAAPLEEVDFVQHAEQERKRINGWVEEQTEKRISDLIPPKGLDEDTRLVLVNAIYMKAPWAEPFRAEATKPEPFHVRSGAAQPVPTMVRKDQYRYAKKDGYTAVTIPYIGRQVHFLVLVPDDVKGLAALEKQLTAQALADCAQLPGREVILHLPKFKMEPPTVRLGKELQAMGMMTAFDQPEGSANFERMAPRKPNDYLLISEVFHKTFIELDEKGTEAAAATAVVMARPASAVAEPPKPVEVKVDRPFLFAIQHRPSGACLFLGRITAPR